MTSPSLAVYPGPAFLCISPQTHRALPAPILTILVLSFSALGQPPPGSLPGPLQATYSFSHLYIPMTQSVANNLASSFNVTLYWFQVYERSRSPLEN